MGRTFMKAPAAQAIAALLISASRRTMAVPFPPSSITIGFKYFPASDAMILPTSVLPQKLIFLTAGCSISISVTLAASCGRWERKLRHPLGRPASWKISAIAQKHRGLNSDPLRMVVFPAARAKHIARTPKVQGAFLYEASQRCVDLAGTKIAILTMEQYPIQYRMAFGE